MKELLTALTDLGYSKWRADNMAVADLYDLVDRLEAALSAYEQASGLSAHAIIKRRLEAVFEVLGITEGEVQATKREGRVTAQWVRKP